MPPRKRTHATRSGESPIGLKLRLTLRPGFIIGPGKADLLELIGETGSIAAAGRRMDMSYKHAWLLVEGMNQNFSTPLVETSKGGAAGGGAVLTPLGEEVLARFRRIEALATRAIAEEVRHLRRKLVEDSEEK